ncbi:MAG: hypothetical protein Q8M09_08120 [Pseudomonadota bacterium]|nr:hypothetical protein [Pseudomonadota bacterium]MDP1904194.1 hypothetical protein [Pseudomonadota bacterium]
MLSTLLRLAIVAAGTGWAASNIDPQVLEKVESTIKGFAGQSKQTGATGNTDVSGVAAKAVGAIQAGTTRPGEFVDLFGAEPQEPTSGRKAFFNKLPKECHGEKVIDLNGRVNCSAPER